MLTSSDITRSAVHSFKSLRIVVSTLLSTYSSLKRRGKKCWTFFLLHFLQEISVHSPQCLQLHKAGEAGELVIVLHLQLFRSQHQELCFLNFVCIRWILNLTEQLLGVTQQRKKVYRPSKGSQSVEPHRLRQVPTRQQNKRDRVKFFSV